MGRPPKLHPVRAYRGPAQLVELPAEGRPGDPPVWPLGDPASADELVVWAELWSSPQAVAWERSGCVRVVARYARMLAKVEATPQAALLSEVRQLEDRLGLSPMAMLRLRWVVADPEGTNPQAVPAAPAKRRPRLHAVDERADHA